MPKFELTKEICQYVTEYVGSEWGAFWRYKSAFKNPYHLFDNIYRTSYFLYCYLVQFGMARNYRSILRNYSSTEFIELIKKYAKILNKHDFLELRLESPEDFTTSNIKTVNNIFRFLENLDQRTNYLFVSKIMMAIWGYTVAYDRYFIAAFKDLHNESPNKFDWAELNKVVLEYEYCSLMKSRKHLTILIEKKYGCDSVPNIRLVDMGYWNWGNKIWKQKSGMI